MNTAFIEVYKLQLMVQLHAHNTAYRAAVGLGIAH